MTNDLGELIVSTKFSSIYRNGTTAVKVTPIASVVKPHDPVLELALLRRLQANRNPHIIELIASSAEHGVITLKFPYYKQNMYQYLLTHFQKRRWNPYLLSDQALSKPQRTNMLPIEQCVGFFKQIAEALRHIHSQGIIHRDVKLQNVLVDERPSDVGRGTPTLVLIDFGIAYEEALSKEPKDSKIIDVSTSIYKAPELLFSVKNYSSAVDIWALLVVVSHLFQTSSTSDKYVPAFVEDGFEELDQGSDIRLISSIFRQLGIPALQEWPEVRDFGSPAFEGMFGTSGDGRYIANRTEQNQRETCIRLFPRVEEVSEPSKTHLINCLLRMMPFESSQRVSAHQILDILQDCGPVAS
ncbi:LANO_0D09912g1_1 [Lachancea nothofagi CBS 11611]|uniref:LANO_0D09912g1_1 n=1 Tax=Lachancea nothofagi CBS 11611 TaxID=1266666 RepID=A0A1G4JK25_9SACH|nr:LANO_0D09912g1_1 [Lachancea nothofagi CBS 11611]